MILLDRCCSFLPPQAAMCILFHLMQQWQISVHTDQTAQLIWMQEHTAEVHWQQEAHHMLQSLCPCQTALIRIFVSGYINSYGSNQYHFILKSNSAKTRHAFREIILSSRSNAPSTHLCERRSISPGAQNNFSMLLLLPIELFATLSLSI